MEIKAATLMLYDIMTDGEEDMTCNISQALIGIGVLEGAENHAGVDTYHDTLYFSIDILRLIRASECSNRFPLPIFVISSPRLVF